MKKFFVVGCQRSGTTMLQQALNRHPQIVIPPETAFFTHFLGHSRRGQLQHLRRINADLKIEMPPPSRRISRPSDAAAFFERIAGLYLDRIGRTNVELFGEKTPHHILRIDRIARVFPDAKIILIYRDGRDVAISLTKVPWFNPNVDVAFGYWLRCYRCQQRAVQCGTIDLLCVKYEALVSHPEKELRRISGFLGLVYEPQMAEGHGSPEGVLQSEHTWKHRSGNKITTSQIGHARKELSQDQTKHLERWGRRELTELGYELSNEPTGRLPWTFLPRVYWRVFRWRTGNAWRVMVKDLLGR